MANLLDISGVIGSEYEYGYEDNAAEGGDGDERDELDVIA